MLNSGTMANQRPTVRVTDLEYAKAEATFSASVELRCLPAPTDEAALATAIRESGAVAAIVGTTVYNGPLYTALPPGGVLARFGVGYDGIDVAKATAARLLCTNTPGVLNRSVAEHTLLLIAAAARGIVPMAAGMTGHHWRPMIGIELGDKTLAIVGCGGIGREVARIAEAGYGMRVIGCSRPDAVPASLPHFTSITGDFATAVADADFVSLHMSATPDNVGWLNAARLACLHERSWLINTARGFLIDEGALFIALAERRLAGAALDVFAREPYEPATSGRDLRSLPNVILTPHVGSNTAEANRRIAERALRNIVLAGRQAFAEMDLLNPEVLPSS
jgi:phosphoglycerate dehydrogenase-like enzyme